MVSNIKGGWRKAIPLSPISQTRKEIGTPFLHQSSFNSLPFCSPLFEATYLKQKEGKGKKRGVRKKVEGPLFVDMIMEGGKGKKRVGKGF